MSLVYLVLLMALVTYLPRMLPLVLLQNITLPKYIKCLMSYIPYAALGALVFPGVLQSTGSGHLDSALTGFLVAIILAWFELNLIVVVFGAISGCFLANLFF